jgi:two-component system chemotaxis response regulator CheY
MNKDDIRILLVDDQGMSRVLVRMELTRLGFQKIEEAEEGRTALTMLEYALEEGKPFSIIICDWNMPDMNGLELLKQIRNDFILSTLPFIMLTAEAEMESVMKVMQAGATDYLVKPISPEYLAKKMTFIMEKVFGNAA